MMIFPLINLFSVFIKQMFIELFYNGCKKKHKELVDISVNH